ncbi:MAG: hypothetical protein KME54_17575 [Tolypothrix brevis GSE-NOS-MK-07-07A]|jgi:hypothetical protein|nr:hypothetical protein [Tolypothrix brevis GSE-NOS-MK-07-07A]
MNRLAIIKRKFNEAQVNRDVQGRFTHSKKGTFKSAKAQKAEIVEFSSSGKQVFRTYLVLK